ncbi:MAG: hypothetical protein KJT03_20565, partial [Verrucomicrobiae bacterium]|nr:hypothetical protein [Verrucomicrobiae bacterium]
DETQGAGWVVRYIGTDGTGPVDLTELIKDAGGAVFDMPGNEVLDFSIEVQSNPEATSEQVGILMTLADSANPGESLDAVEIAIMRSDTWIEVEPRYPLVGHQASVTVNFKNTTGETLTNVAPGFIVAETSIFAGGAEVELLTEDPEPPVVASVADQEEVSFVYFYRMKEEGLVDFESAVFGTKVDNSKFESTLGESERIDIGKVAVISADLVQALPKVPVVSGKATAWYVTISNTSPEAQYVSFEKILRTGGVEERKGGEWDALLPGTFSDLYSLEEEGAFSNLPPEPGEIEFVLFGDDLTVEDYFGRSATGSYEPVSTFPLGVIFVSVGFQPELGFPPVQNEIADALRMLHGQFLGQVFPMPSTELPPLGTADFYLNPGDFSEEVSQNVLTILGLAENWALLNGVTRLVTLFPEDSRIWFGNAEGAPASLSSPAFKHAPAVLGSEEVAINYPDTTASEILRTFGFSDTSNGPPPIEEGFEIFRNSAEILEELPDLMQSPKSPESWISKEQYEAMLFILLNPTPDPEVLIVSGSINQAEEVSANAWYTGFTDQVTQLQTEGVYSIKFLDD